MRRFATSLYGRVLSLFIAATACISLASMARAASPTLIAQPGVTAPGSIAELARALKNDVSLIYEYVYTNIDYSPTYGVKKGALGTLLDGYGNDFDQAALMVALLRQSGYTANYVYGQIRLSPTQLQNWLSVDTSNYCTVETLLVQGGIPFVVTITGPPTPPNCTNTLVSADIAHVWVSVTGGSLGTTTYVYDPSFKTYTPTAGIGLASVMGYNQATFISAAKSGATITSDSIQNLNTANLQHALTGYANNLISYVKANIPTATMKDIVGGKLIQPLTQPYSPQTSLSYETPGDTPVTWTGDIPNMYRTTMQILIGGIDKTYYADEIYGHRLSIVYDNGPQPVLSLDGIAQGTGSTSSNIITYNVSLPFCFSTTGTGSAACSSFGTNFTNIVSAQNTVAAASGYTYAIVSGWDQSGRGMVEFHRRQLQANQAAGAAPQSESVLGEALNMIGYSWLAQTSTVFQLQDRIIGSKVVTHCIFGVVGQTAGPYIDIPGGFVGVSSLTSDTNRAVTAFFSDGGHASAFEWGTLDQNFLKSNVGAVSTVKLLDIANTNGLAIFDAVDKTSWASIKKLLTGYTNPTPDDIETNYISKGYRVILPARGDITQNGWTGAGYLATIIGSTRTASYGISPNLKGGYPDASIAAASIPAPVNQTTPVLPNRIDIASSEPIDLATGAYFYDRDDIATGSSTFPFGLAFHRSYTSNNRYTAGPLGQGWSHGFAINAAVNSDGLKGMGQDSPIDGAAAIAGAYVVQDLMSDTNKPFDKFLIATLAQRWFMDRLINNTVNVAMGSQSEQFMLLADGSYNPQLGSSSRLSLGGGAYALQYKDNTTLYFNGAGNIETWVNPASVTVTFNYDASSPPLLTSVSNGLNSSLALSYNGSNQVIGVTDSTGRSVAYSYDGSGNLTSFTDPIGGITNFSYTPPGGVLTPGLLTQIFYPSFPSVPFVTNTYDTLGRVASQASANNAPGNDTTWNYYFAGYRSEEVDAYGIQHALYYNPRGKALFEIQDIANLNRVTANLYDGLDRLASTTLPEGNSIAYTYDATTNPWANNIASVTRNPKPGSSLTATTTSFRYDPAWNKVNRSTDALGLVSTFLYDGKGNAIEAVADAGGTQHFNATSRFDYDAYGRLLTAEDPMGTVARYSYDNFERLTAVVADSGVGRLNLTTAYTYDLTGNITSQTDPRGNTATMTHDAARRLLSATPPAPFDSGALLLQITYAYDPDGRVTSVSRGNSAASQVISTAYTRTGKIQSVTDPNGNATSYIYDLDDRVASVTAGNNVTRYTFDALGRLQTVIDNANNVSARYAYSANGRQVSFTDGRGNVTTYNYDGFDRPSQTTYAYGTGLASSEASTYDADDNITSRTTRKSDTINFAYDTLNRLITKTPPSPAPVVSYGYNLAGRITSVGDTSSSITAAVPPSGTSDQYATIATYDALNRPNGFTWTPAATAATPAAINVTFSHAYNSINQRTNQTVSDNTWLYYPSGTSSIAFTSNALNQYSAVSAVTPTYDANGNLTYDGTFTFGYDAENRLISASGAGNTITYAYDGQGRRKRKTVNGTITLYVTDADNREVLEYDGTTGQLQNWYAYGVGTNDALNQMNLIAGTRQTLIPDIQGSTIATMDSSTGTLTKRGYFPYGESSSTTGSFGYVGLRIDAETNGLYYARARMYSPVLGRLLQPDPIGYAGGRNLYTYVGNDPLNLIDPQGLAAESFGNAVSTYYGAATKSVIDSFATSPAATIGRALGGVAAYATGVATGDPNLTNAALEGLAATQQENTEALIMLGTMGRGRAAGEAPASTPVGRLGAPMDIPRGTNADTAISGRDFGGHAIDQMQGRGVPPSAVENTIRTGTPSPDPIPGRIRYYDPTNKLTVITESNGKVVTVITGQR